jgi:hypothetical protein
VPLTWPDADPQEKDNRISYKAAFLKCGVWDSVLKLCLQILVVPYSARTEKDHARLRLLICLIRNVLIIDDGDDSISSTNQKYWHSTLQVLKYHAGRPSANDGQRKNT